MPELRAVLFDLYDTLVWSDWPRHARFLAHHLGVSEEQIVSAYDRLREERDGGEFADAGAVLTAVVRYCNLEAEPDAIRDLVRLEAEMLAGAVHLYDDSLPALRRLRAEGFLTGIISNCSPATRPVVDRLGLEEETGVVILSCEVGSSKPSPAIFTTALEALEIPAQAATFVDDRADYLDGAARLGIQTVQIARALSFGEGAEAGAHPTVGDLHQLVDLLV